MPDWNLDKRSDQCGCLPEEHRGIRPLDPVDPGAIRGVLHGPTERLNLIEALAIAVDATHPGNHIVVQRDRVGEVGQALMARCRQRVCDTSAPLSSSVVRRR